MRKFKNSLILISVFFTIVIQGQNINVTERSHLAYPNKQCANICGYVDSLGKEY